MTRIDTLSVSKDSKRNIPNITIQIPHFEEVDKDGVELRYYHREYCLKGNSSRIDILQFYIYLKFTKQFHFIFSMKEQHDYWIYPINFDIRNCPSDFLQAVLENDFLLLSILPMRDYENNSIELKFQISSSFNNLVTQLLSNKNRWTKDEYSHVVVRHYTENDIYSPYLSFFSELHHI